MKGKQRRYIPKERARDSITFGGIVKVGSSIKEECVVAKRLMNRAIACAPRKPRHCETHPRVAENPVQARVRYICIQGTCDIASLKKHHGSI